MKKIWTCYGLLEVFFLMMFFLIFSCAGYFYFFHDEMTHFLCARTDYHEMQNTLKIKHQNYMHQQLVQQQLHEWQKKDVGFYTAIQNLSTTDQLSQQLSLIVIQNNLTISEMKPISKTTFSNTAPAGQLFEFVTRGSFKNLIAALSAISEFPWPVEIENVKINHAGIFHLRLLARGEND